MIGIKKYELSSKRKLFLRVIVYGAGRTGKTTLFCTAPGTKGVIPADPHCMPVIDKAVREGRLSKSGLFVPDKPLVRVTGNNKIGLLQILEKNAQAQQKNYQLYVKAIRELLAGYIASNITSILFDGGSTFAEALDFATFGRTEKIIQYDRSKAWKQFEDIFSATEGRNLIVTFQQKAEYRRGNPTGEMTFRGPECLSYMANVIVETFCPQTEAAAERWSEYGRKVAVGQFGMRVSQCQMNPGIVKDPKQCILLGKECNFIELATRVVPGTDVDDWVDQIADEEEEEEDDEEDEFERGTKRRKSDEG